MVVDYQSLEKLKAETKAAAKHLQQVVIQNITSTQKKCQILCDSHRGPSTEYFAQKSFS